MRYLAIHHTAVSRERQRVQLYAVNRYHEQKWGMRSSLGWYVGYNDFIDVSGILTHTREWGEETVAVQGHNCDVPERCDTISVCIAGNFNRELPVDMQIWTLRNYIAKVRAKYPGIRVVFHRDLQPNRTCAGMLFTDEYLRRRILQEGLQRDDPVDEEKEKEISQHSHISDTVRALLPFYRLLLAKLKIKK